MEKHGLQLATWAFQAPETQVWRLIPAPGVLALELRDVTAQRVEFVVLAAADGRELLRYHDPAMPWWLTLVGLTATELLLAPSGPAHPGPVEPPRAIRLPPAARRAVAAANAPPPTAGVPVVYEPTSAHFAALAQFVAARTGTAPANRIEYLECGPWLIVAADQCPDSGAQLLTHTLLICATLTGAVATSHCLGVARPGPEAGFFCTFGAILYALGAPGEVIAWALPDA